MKGIATIIVIMAVLAIAFSLINAIHIFSNSKYYNKPVTLELIDNYCENKTAYFVVRNGGNTTFANNSLACVKNDDGCTGECTVDSISPSGAGYIKIYNCSSGSHSFKLTGPTNTLALDTKCS